MSFHFNPKLVTDGLIWAMDIANPTSFTPPYGGSGNNINDLTIYNNNFTLISSSGRPYTYSPDNLGSMDFFNDSLTSQTLGSEARLFSSINTGANFSVFFWVFPYSASNGTIINRNTIMTNAYNFQSGQKNGWFFLTVLKQGTTVTNNFAISIGYDTSEFNGGNGSLTPNQWQYIGFTVANNGQVITAYKNDRLLRTSTALNSDPINYSYQTSSLARRIIPTNQPDRFSGSLAAGHIYNRVLTHQEVGQNYNAYKARFGLIE